MQKYIWMYGVANKESELTETCDDCLVVRILLKFITSFSLLHLVVKYILQVFEIKSWKIQTIKNYEQLYGIEPVILGFLALAYYNTEPPLWNSAELTFPTFLDGCLDSISQEQTMSGS